MHKQRGHKMPDAFSTDTLAKPFPKVAVVLVNYRKGKRMVEGLKSVRRQSVAGTLTTVIVDNSTSECETRLLRASVRSDERLVINGANEGYSKACNAGVKTAGPSDYVFLLNPDVIMDDRRTVEVMVGAMEADPSIGILGCLQRNDDGSYVETARYFPKLSKQVMRRLKPGAFTEERLLESLLAKPPAAFADVDWLQSSFMFVRRQVWDRLGGLDEAYYIFMADVDICRRAHRIGSRVVITSKATVRADGLRASAGSLRDVFNNRVLRIHIADAVKYYWRTS
jgi:N-acetylglucosaminyl-diphospho-decaprenol L-rhamnosyltransferase